MPNPASPSFQPELLALLADPGGGPAPGCAAAVFRSGGRNEIVCAGFADIDARRLPDPDTLFYAGSLAKQFTALAIVQQVLEGRVGLDDDIRRHLPEAPTRSSAVTVGMLLHHTSGLPNYAKLSPLAGHRSPRHLTREGVLRMLFAYPDTAFPPGDTFEYSNGGYLLLSEIVARLSGRSFGDYVRAHILEPLGMRRSRILEAPLPADPNRAIGYLPTTNGFAVSEEVPTFGGAGAIMLTLRELGLWFDDITSGERVWTPEVTQLMTAPALYADGSPVILPIPGHIFGYAGGLMLSRDWVLHGGNFAGFQAMFGWLPGADLGVAVLCNRGDVDPLKMATRIVAAAAPEAPPPDAPRFTLAGLEGRFASDLTSAVYDVTTDADGETLRLSISPAGGGEPVSMTLASTGGGAYADGAFRLLYDPDRRAFRLFNEGVAVRCRRLA